MKIAGLPLLHEFSLRHSDVKRQIESWIAEVTDAQWKSSMDVKARYSTASFLSGNRVVFNLKGHKYRLLVKIAYRTQTVLVQAIGTHEEYDKWGL